MMVAFWIRTFAPVAERKGLRLTVETPESLHGAFDAERPYLLASASKILSAGILMRLADARLADLRAIAPEDARAPVLPKAVLEPGPDGAARLAVVMPHDPGYGDLPGDAGEAPPRALDLPTRLVREGTTWKPC